MCNQFSKLILFVIISVACCLSGQSQTITGPACVVPGTIYQYNIDANWDSTTDFRICIEGGFLEDQKTSCVVAKTLPVIKVIWKDDISEGIISVLSKEKDIQFNVGITRELNAGSMDTTETPGTLSPGKKPSLIVCSAATGGNCDAVYVYQWQESRDNLKWIDIKGMTGTNLQLETAPDVTTYYRRKVTEKKSGTITFSEPAWIIMDIPADMNISSKF